MPTAALYGQRHSESDVYFVDYGLANRQIDSDMAVTNLKCNLDWRNFRVRLRWVSYIRGIVWVDC